MVSESEERKTTLIDTGFSAHVNADKTNRLTNFRKKTELISFGDTSMKSTSQGRGDLGPLRNVMYAPGMSFNLISVSAMEKLGRAQRPAAPASASKRTILAGLKVNAFKGAQCTYAQCKDLEIGPCEGCMLGNMRANSIPVSHRTYSTHKPMQEVGIDLVPLSTTTIDGGSVANMGIDYVTKLMFCYEARTDG
ncbi:hypothetical protein B484DRAFT_438753 [Ochromonadaceae sp. CCMP2298]|nr:hypothetical protein B484DRAFT_438753 [Ochromonadaceae sp. CCMP2298]